MADTQPIVLSTDDIIFRGGEALMEVYAAAKSLFVNPRARATRGPTARRMGATDEWHNLPGGGGGED